MKIFHCKQSLLFVFIRFLDPSYVGMTIWDCYVERSETYIPICSEFNVGICFKTFITFLDPSYVGMTNWDCQVEGRETSLPICSEFNVGICFKTFITFLDPSYVGMTIWDCQVEGRETSLPICSVLERKKIYSINYNLSLPVNCRMASL